MNPGTSSSSISSAGSVADVYLLALSLLPALGLAWYWVISFKNSSNRSAALFSPLTFLLMSVAIGVFLRTWFILLDPYAQARGIYLLAGADPRVIFPEGLLCINISLVAWLAGYHFYQRRSVPQGQYRYVFDDTRYFYFVLAIFAVGIANAIYMLLQFKGAAPDGSYHISAKRYETTPDGDRIISTVGYARYVYDFIVAAFFVLTLRFLTHQQDKFRFIYFLTFVVVIFYPFASSSQSDIIYIMLFFAIAQTYIRGSISPVHLLILVLITASTSAIMFELRLQRSQAYDTEFVDPADPAVEDPAIVAGGERGEGGEGGETSATGQPLPGYVPRHKRTIWDKGARAYHRLVQKLIYRPYFVGVVKTSLVIDKMERDGSYLYGASYGMLLVAIVPRSLWPDKPIVRIGRYVGKEVFERTNYSGVPPAFVGEAFLNFGWAGIFLISILLGVMSKWVLLTFGGRFDGGDVMKVGVFAILIIAVHGILSVDFLGGVMRGLRYLIPFLLIMLLVYRREPLSQTATSNE